MNSKVKSICKDSVDKGLSAAYAKGTAKVIYIEDWKKTALVKSEIRKSH